MWNIVKVWVTAGAIEASQFLNWLKFFFGEGTMWVSWESGSTRINWIKF